jgi:hypothetical protein
MKTVLAILPLVLSSIVVWKLSLFALNIAGLPGALIARGTSDKSQSTAGALRFLLAVIVSTIGQSYVYLAFVALIVNLTKTAMHGGGVLRPVLWPVAFIASFVPIYFCTAAATAEALGCEESAQEIAVGFTEILTVIGFFFFVFFPKAIAVGWSWVPYGSQ